MERIQSLDDPRIAPYRNLRDRTLRGESIFLTEGRVLTLRLLESDYGVESVFVTDEFAEEFQRIVAPEVQLFVASQPLMLQVVGFNFHRGVLAVGRRRPSLSLEELLDGKQPADTLDLIICPEITKPENMGLIFRTAAAFGVEGILLGERCCDPFSRRCLRLSMGATLQTPFGKSAGLMHDLRLLKERYGLELLAAVLDAQAEQLAELRWPRRAGILFGNESDGLRDEWISLCDRRVTIPMQAGVDSLNLGVAAGIFIYEMKGRSRLAD